MAPAGRRTGHIDVNSSQKFGFIVKMDSVPVRYRVARTLVATPWPRPTPTNLNLQRRLLRNVASCSPPSASAAEEPPQKRSLRLDPSALDTVCFLILPRPLPSNSHLLLLLPPTLTACRTPNESMSTRCRMRSAWKTRCTATSSLKPSTWESTTTPRAV